MLKRFCLLISIVSLGAIAQAMDPNEQLLFDMQHSQFPDSYESLLVGDTQVPMVVREATTVIGKGVAVILTESGKGPLHYEGVAALASQLNQYGWVTFSIPMPLLSADLSADEEKEVAEPAEATEATEATEANDANDSEDSSSSSQTMPAPIPAPPRFTPQSEISPQRIQQQQQQIQALMLAAANRALDYTGFFMVISQGTSAAWLTKLYAEAALDTPDALVMVSPFWPDRNLNNQLPELVANTPMPVLDVFSDWDNSWVSQTHTLRQIAAKKGLKLHYRQRQLLGLPLHEQQQFAYLAKEIYGWVSHMGW